MSKLLVIGGSGSRSAEVINLDQTNPDLVCDNINNPPASVINGIGDLLDGKTPIYCGGYIIESDDTSSECHAYSKGYWNKITSLNDKRTNGDSVLMEISSGNSSQEMLLLIGGTNSIDGNFDSTDAFDGQVRISPTTL